MESMSRKQARQEQAIVYFTGKPCKWGHISQRYTKNGTCIECDHDPERRKRYDRKYKQNNLNEAKERCRDWREKNPSYHSSYNEDWNKNNPNYASEWRSNNMEKVLAARSKRRAALLNANVEWADNKKIEEIYCESLNITNNTGIQHHVDHIYPLQGKHVCGLHCEDNLQILTAKENLKKSNATNETLDF